MPGPRLPVDSPAITPRQFGLLSVAEIRNSATSHWQNGVTWNAACLDGGATTYDECITVTGAGEIPPPSVKTDNLSSTYRGATPFTVFTKFDCSPVGNTEALATAEAALRQREAFQVERAFWTGRADNDLVVFPRLAASAPVTDGQGIVLQTSATTLGTVDDVAVQLGRLEEALAECYGGVGVIHIPVAALATFDAWGLVERTGSRDGTTGQFGPQLRTRAGNLVAVGGGYPGTSPAGATPAAGTAWIYATGAIFAYRSRPRVIPMRESIDRALNTIEALAERTYVFGWDCCHFAALVTLGVPT